MQKPTENITASDRRLQKACEYVSDLWFPVNSELLAKIKLGIQGGVYDLDPETLVSNISGDFSLFMYCFRELMQMLKQEGANLPPLSNPIDVLRAGGLERLKKILDIEEAQISKHSFESIDEVHIDRMQETLVSASSSQVLAESFNLDPEVGFSAALLRQLGHTLIAWNYPTVYKEALTSIDKDTPLDVAIAERLGFSPTLLAIRILISWGLPVEFCEALFILDEDQELDEEELLEEDLEPMMFHHLLAGSLSKLCSVGEALARANNPKLYPTAQKDWEYAKEEIAQKLGPQGMELIRDALAENIDNYATFMPEIFTGAFILEPELHLAEAERDGVITRNPYLVLCDPPLRAKLTSLYLTLTPGHLSERALSDLVKNIIPSSGFTGGCVYTVDPGIQMLVPQTKIGKMKFKLGKSVDYSLVTSNSDGISVAFRSADPVVEFHMNEEQELVNAIAGVIGHSNRVGVLYLEIPHELYSQRENDYLSQFKAFARALTDCLNLG